MTFPPHRPRRLRRSETIRRLVRETRLSPDDLIAPLFVTGGEGVRQEIAAMPGCHRLGVDRLLEECRELHGLGVPGVILFGIPGAKDAEGTPAWDPEGPVPRALRALRAELPELSLWADVCLCEYTDHGHCGPVGDGPDGRKEVLNDRALPSLARAALAYAEADLRRKRDLAAARLLPASELDLAERASAMARQQEAEAAASLELAATQLEYGRIHAPIAGVVASVSTQEGETVAASLAAPTFVTLLDLTRLEVWAYVDETDIGRIRRGQAARFSVDTYAGHEFEGRVTEVYPQAAIRDNVVNYVTVVRFEPPPDHVLRPEMTATVTIGVELREDVLAVPRRAVRREDGRTFVRLRRGDGLERRWVETGSRDESHWEVVAGLSEGDEVAVGDTAAR